MSKWITIARHEYAYNVLRKEFLFVTFGLPLFIFAIAGLPVLLMNVGTVSEEYSIGYVDRTGLFESGNFIQYTDETSAKKDLLDGKITHFFVIPEDYIETGKVEIYSPRKGLAGSRAVEDMIRVFLLENLLKGQKKDIVERAKTPIIGEYFTLNEKGESGGDGLAALFVSIAFAVFFMLSIFTSSNFLLQGVVEEKENRVIEILLSSVSHRELLVGKIFGLGAVGLTQILIWLLLGIVLLFSNPGAFTMLLDRMNVSIPLLVFASGYFILGYMIFASLLAGVGAVATTAREGHQMAGFFSITGAVPLIISQYIITNPGSVLTILLSYFPLTSPVTIIMRISLAKVQFYEILISVLVLMVSTLIIIELSVRVFRASLLMYGKKPAIGEVVKYLRKD